MGTNAGSPCEMVSGRNSISIWWIKKWCTVQWKQNHSRKIATKQSKQVRNPSLFMLHIVPCHAQEHTKTNVWQRISPRCLIVAQCPTNLICHNLDFTLLMYKKFWNRFRGCESNLSNGLSSTFRNVKYVYSIAKKQRWEPPCCCSWGLNVHRRLNVVEGGWELQ